MTGFLFRSLGMSLGLTLVLELAFALLCGKRRRALLLTALVNLLTNPIVVWSTLLWRMYALPGGALMTALAEILAFLTEGLIYKKSREFSRPFVFSLCANAFSYGAGLMLNHLI
ncbi:MAG: hypothetical protein IKD79_05345 [Oscillospiraceae bacterium]|nr:hypothetical protein [Oscillospiraceae bacterium]